jgi:hypothetical protein
MNKKQLVFGALLGLPTLANADATFRIADLKIAAGETKTVNVNIDVTDATELSTYQMDIKLPKGLYFKSFDNMTTQTDYGWQLMRSYQGIDAQKRVNRVRFFGQNLDYVLDSENKLTKDSPTKLAFSFDVIAGADYDTLQNNEIQDIEVVDGTLKATDVDKPYPYTPDGEIKAVNGDVTRLFKLNSDYNYLTLKDETRPSQTITLTPTHAKELTVGLVNMSVKDADNNELNPWGLRIRGLEGDIILPKGLEAVNYGTGNQNKFIRSVAPRTTGENLLSSVKTQADGTTKVHFIISSTQGGIRNYAEFADSLFTFNVKANNDFTAGQDQILIQNVIIDAPDKEKGIYRSFTMDDLLTVIVNNPDSAAKADWDKEIGKEGDETPVESVWPQYEAAVNAVNDSVRASSAVLAQEEAAKEAIKALTDSVAKHYGDGTLVGWDGSALQEAAEKAIAKIDTVNDETMIKAREYAQLANDSIANKYELDVPDSVNAYAPIVAIKNVNDENNGSLKVAKEELKKYLDAAVVNGTLGDNEATVDEEKKSLKDLEAAIEEQNNLLKKAIDEATGRATTAYNEAQAALGTELPKLPSNVSNDDTPESFNMATANVNNVLKKALTDKINAAKQQGTYADNNIFKDEIEALLAAIGVDDDPETDANEATGLYKTLQEVVAKADENNKKAAVAVDVEKNPYKKLPEAVANDDSKGTYAAALAKYEAAVKALNDSVDSAAVNGNQAKDGVYNALIKAVNDSISGIADSVGVVVAKGEANVQKVKDAKATEAAQQAALNTPENNAEIAENKEYMDALEAYEKSLEALNDTVDKAAANGNQAKDDVFADAIENFENAADSLNKVVNKLKDIAAANEQALKDEAAKATTLPEGTGKNDAYADIKESEAIKELELKLQNLKGAVTDSISKYVNAGEIGNTPNPLQPAIKDIEAARTALETELKEQSKQAALNYDKADSVKTATVLEPKNEDAKDAKIVTDAKAEMDEARQGVENQYQNMVNNHKTGDAAETEKLNNLVETLDEKTEAYEDAVAIADEAIDSVNAMNADVVALNENLTVTEVGKARVANPYADIQEEGKLQTKNWKENYDQLMIKLTAKSEDIQAKVDKVKAAFMAGTIGKDSVVKFQDETMKELAEKANEEAVKLLVDYLIANQRGDVGGDGRLTTNDYAREQYMFLYRFFPKAEWNEVKNSMVNTDKGITVLEGGTSEDAYLLALYDINRDGVVGIGDQQAALNGAFYGDYRGQEQARVMNDMPEQLTARANGNIVAVALQSTRQYGIFAIDVKLAEGMSLKNVSTALRTEGFGIATNELENGLTRILVSPAEPKAFEGTEGDLIYLELAGNGNVEFQQVVFADMNCAEKKFRLDAVAAGETTGIGGVNAETGVMQSIYNLGGRMVNGLKKGINIIRNANGETQKVIKK